MVKLLTYGLSGGPSRTIPCMLAMASGIGSYSRIVQWEKRHPIIPPIPPVPLFTDIQRVLKIIQIPYLFVIPS